jgi:Right handed beta helix region
VSDCSVNVSAALQTWLQGLAPGTIWYSPVGSCYLIDNGINLTFPRGITIDGGVFTERSLGWLGRRGFFVIGGSNMTFEHMTIQGPNMTNVWDPARAFQSGIELDGTTNAVIANVRINNVFGDGITLSPLRGSADHSSGVIIRPVTNLTITNVWIDGAGRQGISPVSVQNATMTNVTLHSIDMNAFDFETDGQGNEGAENVTINGCNVDGANSLANISENAGFTGPITFENCNMTMDGGTAVYVRSTSNSIENGQILFTHDTLRCPTTAPVACIQMMNGQNVEFADSTIAFGSGEPNPTENVYSAVDKTNASFDNDVVTGYGGVGSFDKTSHVNVSGGTWTRG